MNGDQELQLLGPGPDFMTLKELILQLARLSNISDYSTRVYIRDDDGTEHDFFCMVTTKGIALTPMESKED